MITPECLETVLPIVADSWEQLRSADVYRLIDNIAYENIESLCEAGKIIIGKCPQLESEVQNVVDEIAQLEGWR